MSTFEYEFYLEMSWSPYLYTIHWYLQLNYSIYYSERAEKFPHKLYVFAEPPVAYHHVVGQYFFCEINQTSLDKSIYLLPFIQTECNLCIWILRQVTAPSTQKAGKRPIDKAEIIRWLIIFINI